MTKPLAVLLLALLSNVDAFLPLQPSQLHRRVGSSSHQQSGIGMVATMPTEATIPENIASLPIEAHYEIAEREDAKFVCDPSVQFWRSFSAPDANEAASIIRKVLQPHLAINSSAKARAYWLYHAIRVSYFTGNALLGLSAFSLHETLRNNNQNEENAQAVDVGNVVTSNAALLLSEAFLSMDQNWKWVDEGVLNFPWDSTLQTTKDSTDDSNNNIRFQLDHKQANPLFVLAETRRLIQDSIGIWGRRNRLNGEPAGVWMNSVKQQSSSLYPDYYLNDFHYQQDGWLSSTSAERYEVSTETLFFGKQDSMQRQTLVPIRLAYSQEAPPATMLEVACGTGRYATFARDNFPTTNMTLVDLSPFYLEKAKANIEEWQKQRGKEAMQIATGSLVDAPDTTLFVQANAEQLPFPDNSFEVVTTVYLFHELPPAARRNVVREMARVCQPGGMVVFSDSFQIQDRPLAHAAAPLDGFSKLNEPHYKSYLSEDIPALFETEGGLVCEDKYMNSRTKTMSFRKPE